MGAPVSLEPANLTDRQLEALTLAVTEGHYEIPKDCRIADLAALLGCTPTSAAATLNRAEGKAAVLLLDCYGVELPDDLDERGGVVVPDDPLGSLAEEVGVVVEEQREEVVH